MLKWMIKNIQMPAFQRNEIKWIHFQHRHITWSSHRIHLQFPLHLNPLPIYTRTQRSISHPTSTIISSQYHRKTLSWRVWGCYLKKLACKFERSTFKIDTTGRVGEHITKVNVDDVPFLINQQVWIMSVFHLPNQTPTTMWWTWTP